MIFGSVSTVFLLLYTGCLCHPVHISQDVLKNVTMTPSAKETGYEKSPVVEKKGTIRISGPWHSDSALDRNIDLGEDSYVKKIISSNEGINFNKDMAEAGEMFDVNGIEDFYDKNAVVTYEVNGHEIPVHLKQKYTPQTKVMFPEYSRDSPATGAAIGKSNPPSPPVSESDGKKCRKSFSCLGGSSSSKLISSKSALRSGDDSLTSSKRVEQQHSSQYEEHHEDDDGSAAGKNNIEAEGVVRNVLPTIFDVLKIGLKKMSSKHLRDVREDEEETGKKNYKIENRSLMNNYEDQDNDQSKEGQFLERDESGEVREISENRMSPDDSSVISQPSPNQENKLAFYGNTNSGPGNGQLQSLEETHSIEKGRGDTMRGFDQSSNERFELNQMVNEMGASKGSANGNHINQFASNREQANSNGFAKGQQMEVVNVRPPPSSTTSPTDISWSDVGLDTTNDGRSGSDEDEDKKKAKAKILQLLGLLADKLKGVTLDRPTKPLGFDNHLENKKGLTGNMENIESWNNGGMANNGNRFSSSKSNKCLNIAPEYNHPPLQFNMAGPANSFRASPDEERTVRTLQNTLTNMHRAIESDDGDNIIKGRTVRDFLACVDSLPRVIHRNGGNKNSVSSSENDVDGNFVQSSENERGKDILLSRQPYGDTTASPIQNGGNNIAPAPHVYGENNIIQSNQNEESSIASSPEVYGESVPMSHNDGGSNNINPSSSRYHDFPHADSSEDAPLHHRLSDDLHSDELDNLRHSSQFIVSGTRRGVQQSAPHSHRQSSIHSHSYDRILGNEDNAGEMKDHDIDNGREEVNHIKTADVRKSNEEEGETYKHEVDDQDFASHKHDNRNLPQRDILVDKEGEKLIPETIQKFKDAGKPFIMNTDSIDYKPKDDEDSDDEKDIENKISSPITSKNTNDPTGGIISKFSSKIRTGKSRTDQYHEIVENTDSFTKGKSLEDERTHVSDLGIKQGHTKKIDENEDTDVKSNEYSRESSQRKGRHHNHAFENDDSSRRGSDDDYFVIHARNKENDKTYQDDAHALEDNKNDKNVGRESSNHMSDQEGKAQGEESFAKTKLNEDKEAKEERDMRSHQTAAASEVFSPSHGHSFKDVDKGRDDKDSQVSKEDENPNKNHFMNEYEEGHRESTHENRNPEADSSQRSQGEKDQNRNDDKDSARDNQNQESLKEDRKKSNQRKIQSSESSQEYEDNPRHQKVSGEDAEKTNMKERDPKISYHRERNDEINDDSSKVSPSSHKNDAENSKDSGNNFKDSDTDIMEKHKVHDENESYKEKEVDSKESTNQVKEIGSSQKQSVSDLKEEQNEKGKEYPKKNMEQDSEASFSKNNDQDKSYDHGKEKYNIKDELKSSNVEPVTTKKDERNMKENLSKESSDAPMMTKMSENKEEYITTEQTDNSKKEDGHIADKTSATAESSDKIMKHESEDKNSGREKAMRLLEELNGEKDATPEKKPDTITQEGEVTYKATFHHDDQKESKSHHDEEHHDDHHDDHAYLSEKQENPSPDDSHHKSNESQQYSQSDHYGSQEAQHHQDQDSNHQEHGVENQGEMVSGGGSQANDEEKKVTGGGEVHKSFFSEGASRTESRKNGMISSRQEIGKEKEKERSFTPKTFPTEGKTEYPDYNEVRDAAVFETNLFRKNYHGNQLSWSEKLSDKAQQVADKIGKSFISDNGKQLDDFRHPGQNVALVKPNAANVGKDAVDSWSKESKDYDFKSPLVTKKNSDFVQLTWKNEKEFGLGVSKSIAGNGWVVVGMYDTPFDDRYQDLTSNVLPVKAVEDPYGDISG